jgi:hypothetical protein
LRIAPSCHDVTYTVAWSTAMPPRSSICPVAMVCPSPPASGRRRTEASPLLEKNRSLPLIAVSAGPTRDSTSTSTAPPALGTREIVPRK